MNTTTPRIKMYALAAGYHGNLNVVHTSRKRSVSPVRITRSSSDKLVAEITSMVSAFEPEKAWTKASESFADLATDGGRSIDDFRNSFLQREYRKMLDKVLALVTAEIKDNILVSMIIEKLSSHSGATSAI